jgi:uncharacterized membrane protein YhaH (DUF805 family)
MTFFEAVAKCYRKYLVFSGRASKREYWWFVFLTFLFVWPLFLAEIGTGTWYGFLSFVYFMLTISTVLPLAAVWTRRMHDVGKSAWHGFFFLIPIIGFFLVLRWLTKDGDVGKNKYGSPDNHALTTKRRDTGDDLLEDLSV